MFLTFFEVYEINTKNKPLGSEPKGSLSMGSLLLIYCKPIPQRKTPLQHLVMIAINNKFS